MTGRKTILAVVVVLSLLALAAAPFIGMERIGLHDVLGGAEGDIRHDIFWKLRAPRVLLAFIAGAGLSLSGMSFQALFRNPLATPFTLGVSSGAAFGAALYVFAGATLAGLLGAAGQPLCSLLGAVAAIVTVYGLTRARRGFSTATMLLAGVAINFFFSSLILFIQYLSDFTDSYRLIRWLMGGIETAGFGGVLAVLPFLALGSAVVLLLTNELNLFAMGEETAISRGVDTRLVKTVLFFVVSLMVGAVVSRCGPVGFVGMMCPHICRLVIGQDHNYLAPASLFFGGAFLVLCDLLSRTLIAPAEIPVGVVTALLGGPFFLWLLLGDRSRSVMR